MSRSSSACGAAAASASTSISIARASAAPAAREALRTCQCSMCYHPVSPLHLDDRLSCASPPACLHGHRGESSRTQQLGLESHHKTAGGRVRSRRRHQLLGEREASEAGDAPRACHAAGTALGARSPRRVLTARAYNPAEPRVDAEDASAFKERQHRPAPAGVREHCEDTVPHLDHAAVEQAGRPAASSVPGNTKGGGGGPCAGIPRVPPTLMRATSRLARRVEWRIAAQLLVPECRIVRGKTEGQD